MKSTRNPWPFGIIAAFVIFISGTVGLIVMTATQKTDLVSDNYYEQELKYQSRIDSLGRASQPGFHQASATYDPAGKRILISLPAAHAVRKLTGRIQLYRPSAARLDRQFELDPDSNGLQSVDAGELQNGLWKIRVSWNAEGQEYFLERKIVIGASHPGDPPGFGTAAPR